MAKETYGVSDDIDKISVRGASCTLDQHNSMKIRENAENVLSGLWILLHPNLILVKSLKFFNGGVSTSQARSQHL